MILLSAVLIAVNIIQPNQAVLQAQFEDAPRRDLSFPELVKYDGYKVESYSITTRDGYILSMFRLPLNDSCPEDKERSPIVFIHGLYLSGDDCIIPGPKNAHCYIYVDACYDVWVPNLRGSRYSRKHRVLNPDKDSQFWNFAFDEIALLDLPAIIKFVLKYTGKSKVAYVGHSQAVAILVLLCAKQPKYNDKIFAGFGLSSVAWLTNARLLVVPLQGALAKLSYGQTNFELFSHGGILQNLVRASCGLSESQYQFCYSVIFAFLGFDDYQITSETLRVFAGHFPAGISFKNFVRWGQIKNNGFSEYDFGFLGNMARYGAAKPPLFDLSAVTMKWFLISSENDYIGDVRDIAILKSKLSNVSECILPDKKFGHLGFIYGKNLSNYVTPKILSVLNSGAFECN